MSFVPASYLSAPLVLTHGGVSVYHVHKDDDLSERLLTFWFLLDPTGTGEEAFDVRTLPSWTEEPDDFAGIHAQVTATLRLAIERGELPSK